MSRGFGRVEGRLLLLLETYNRMTGSELASWVAGTSDSPSIRRALKRLQAKGAVLPLPERHERSIVWVLAKTAKAKAARKRWRERDRARGAEENRHERQKYEDTNRAAQRRFDQGRSTARLERLLGMLGSAHKGELSNAAQAVEKERLRLGKTWPELLALKAFEWPE